MVFSVQHFCRASLMGDVVSFSRVSDHDIFAVFETQSPPLPLDLDDVIQCSAARAVGEAITPDEKPFRTACAVVAGLSLLAVSVVQYVSKSVPFSLDAGDEGSGQNLKGNESWRQTKSAWQDYISALEDDPRVKQLNEEKRLYQQKYGR